MPKIAITGTIASGKTTVSDIIRKRGFYVYDCDKYNDFLLKENNEGYLLIKKNFPEAIINNNVDKKILANIVFSSEEKRLLLESLLHPLILDNMIKESVNRQIFFAEVPLLFEKNWQIYFDKTILVVSDNENSLIRLIEKGYKKDEAINRISSQFPVEIKKNLADELIYNNSSFYELENKVDKLLKKIIC